MFDQVLERSDASAPIRGPAPGSTCGTGTNSRQPFKAPGLRSAWYSAQCLVQGNDCDIDVTLALGDRVLRLELRALGIQQ